MFRRTVMSPRRCAICGKKELFLMFRYTKGKTPRLCKRCYDKEIDEELGHIRRLEVTKCI